MQVTMISPFTRQANTRAIETVDPDRLLRWLRGEDREHVQIAFPEMSPEDREFLISGATPEDWETVFGPDGPDSEDADERPCGHLEGAPEVDAATDPTP